MVHCCREEHLAFWPGYDRKATHVLSRMCSQDIWLRKYHELWEKLEDNTNSSFCNAVWKWLVIIMMHVSNSNGYKAV